MHDPWWGGISHDWNDNKLLPSTWLESSEDRRQPDDHPASPCSNSSLERARLQDIITTHEKERLPQTLTEPGSRSCSKPRGSARRSSPSQQPCPSPPSQHPAPTASPSRRHPTSTSSPRAAYRATRTARTPRPAATRARCTSSRPSSSRRTASPRASTCCG